MMAKKVKANPGDPQKSALLIIDVQYGMFKNPVAVYKADELIANILDLVDRAHQAGAPVVYIQHCGEKSLIKGSQEWQLHPGLHPDPEDHTVLKEHGNAFEGTKLGEILASQGVGRVVATGMVTHACVKNTCLGALDEGYEVVLAGDAHSNFSKDAAELIAKWNKTLAEKGAMVQSTAAIRF
jgi:nicotinamidase-related amidase